MTANAEYVLFLVILALLLLLPAELRMYAGSGADPLLCSHHILNLLPKAWFMWAHTIMCEREREKRGRASDAPTLSKSVVLSMARTSSLVTNARTYVWSSLAVVCSLQAAS